MVPVAALATAGFLTATTWEQAVRCHLKGATNESGKKVLGAVAVTSAVALVVLADGYGAWSQIPLLPKFLFSGSVVVIHGLGWFDTLLHELMHAAAARVLYKDAEPKIEVKPFFGGFTRFNNSQMTPLGQRVGKQGSKAIVAAAGVVGQVALAVFEAILIRGTWRSHPLASFLLAGHSLMQIVGVTTYGLTKVEAFGLNAQSHDFCAFQSATGVPPKVSVVALVALPLLGLVGVALSIAKQI